MPNNLTIKLKNILVFQLLSHLPLDSLYAIKEEQKKFCFLTDIYKDNKISKY